MQPVRSEVDKGKGRRRAIYLAVAWSLVIGLLWLYQSSATDREGRSQVALVLTFADSQRAIGGKTLVFAPRLVGGKLEWTCDRGTVEPRYRQQPCRKPD